MRMLRISSRLGLIDVMVDEVRVARDRTEVDEDASKEAAERVRREARRLCGSIVEKLAKLI